MEEFSIHRRPTPSFLHQGGEVASRPLCRDRSGERPRARAREKASLASRPLGGSRGGSFRPERDSVGERRRGRGSRRADGCPGSSPRFFGSRSGDEAFPGRLASLTRRHTRNVAGTRGGRGRVLGRGAPAVTVRFWRGGRS